VPEENTDKIGDYWLRARRSEDRGSIPGGGWEFFSSTPCPYPVLGPTQPLIQWVQGALSLGVKPSWSNADQSPSSSAEVKNAWS
jgi:hypothetical protein